jgi:hypothetical protein
MPMKKFLPLAGLAAILAGCNPTITVANHTSFDVRIIVKYPGGDEALAPSAGNQSSVEVNDGAYSITAFPDEEWIAWAKTTRKVLNDRLADPEHLTGPQLLDVVQRLKDVASKMQDYESITGPPPAGSPGSAEWAHRTWCYGDIPKDGDGALVTITASSDRLTAVCHTYPKQ